VPGIFSSVENANLYTLSQLDGNKKRLLNSDHMYSRVNDDILENVISKIQDLSSIRFAVAIREFFGPSNVQIIDSAQTSANINTEDGKATVQYDNQVISISGNDISIPSPCSFDLTVGDVVRQGGKAVFITDVVDQQNFTVSNASDLVESESATISQVVKTLNLNSIVVSIQGESQAISDLYLEDIGSCLVYYTDSSPQILANDPDVLFLVSSNNLSYSDVNVRPNGMSEILTTSQPPVVSTGLYVIFCSNITSGNGSVDLSNFVVMFHNL